MGNVQSEATQESECAKDGEEKANPDRSKPDRGPSGAKHESGSRPPSPQAPEQKAAGQPLSSEPWGGDRQAGAAEMGKNHSKKSKLKLSSMWAQNSASSGMKEVSLCARDPGPEKRGLACLSRADLQNGQNSGSALQEETKGLKVPPRPSPVVACDPRDLGAKRVAAKGKSKPENAHLGKNVGGLPMLPEKLAEPGQAADAPKDAAGLEACCAQHIKVSTKECLENEGRLPEPLLSARKPPAGSVHGTESSKVTADASAGPRPLMDKSASRPASSMALPGGKKALLSWEVSHREKERVAQQDSVHGSNGDSKGPGLASPLPVECGKMPGSPTEKPQASGNDTKAGAKGEALAAEAVSSETMQELLERGLNFLYKVTIQPGQWPPSVKAVKQKASVLSSGISYADVLKQCPQCPQKKPPVGVPVLPKALHHLTSAGNKLPSFKGLERGSPEDLSSFSQVFLEHFKKVAPKEQAAPHVPSQQVVTFLEEMSTGNAKRSEWQRPRPPTPYPQRHKGQGRKLPTFSTTVSQVVTFLGSDPKCDWFVHDEIPALLDEATMTAEEGGKDFIDPLSIGDKGAEVAGSSQPVAALLLEQEMAKEVERSRRRPQGLEEGAKATIPAKSAPYNAAQGTFSPLAAPQPSQKEAQPPVPLPGPKPHSPSDMVEMPSPTDCATCTPTGLTPDQKVPTTTQARSKIRKQGPAAQKSKEKLKPSGQPKVKVPKGKGQKHWSRGYGMTSSLRLEGAPLFPPFEKVARPFYFGEPSEMPLSQDKPASIVQDPTSTQAGPEKDREADRSPPHQWPAFQVMEACSRKCYCKHQGQRKLPKNVTAWLNPSSNHLAEPPWVATAMLAVSLVAGTKFCLDSYEQQHLTNED